VPSDTPPTSSFSREIPDEVLININPKKMKYTSLFVVAMLMSTSSGISLEKEEVGGVSEGTQKIIDGAVNDVMKSVG
jgi:hypothetical protein